MNKEPSWLPEMFDTSGDWRIVITQLYDLFTNDFVFNPTKFNTMSVWWNKNTLEGESYEEGFWHLITKDYDSTGERYPDYKRAERLPWCKPIIENSIEDAVKQWDYKEGNGKIRTYIWLEHFDYVVILEKRDLKKESIMFLVTAYYIESGNTRRKLNKKYDERIS